MSNITSVCDVDVHDTLVVQNMARGQITGEAGIRSVPDHPREHAKV